MSEASPYKAVRQYEKRVLSGSDKRTFVVYSDFIQRFLQVGTNERRFMSELRKAPYRIDGKVYINPKTGKPLKKAEWQAIKKALADSFTFVYGSSESSIARQAVVLGKILTTMKRDSVLPKIPTTTQEDYLENEIAFAEQHAGELIVDLSTKAQKQIAQEIVQAHRDRISPKELETRLFRTYTGINKDWRRIAETEIATNINNGYVATQVQKGEKYLRGMSSSDACPFCLEYVNNQIVKIVDSPTDTPVYDARLEREVPVVWPGKSNYGRKRADWWVASGAQHPHCRCSWQTYSPGPSKAYADKLEELRAQIGL